jgi:predicted Zn-dependent protease
MQPRVRALTADERGYAEVISVGILLAILIGFALFLYCRAEEQTVPITGRTQRVALSEEDQARLGADAYREILAESAAEIVRSGPEAELVQRVGERIAAVADDPGFAWEFTLIASPLVNAWCLPGGKVSVYSGILEIAQDEEGLAVVMAHEIAHAIAQHGAERMLQEQLTRVGLLAVSATLGGLDPATRGTVLALFGAGAQLGVLLPFSRDMESEADRIGLTYMARAGYNPEAAIGFWERMAAAREGPEPPGYASTHPSNASRIAGIHQWLPEAMEEYRKTLGARPTMRPLLLVWHWPLPAPAQRMAAAFAWG